MARDMSPVGSRVCIKKACVRHHITLVLIAKTGPPSSSAPSGSFSLAMSPVCISIYQRSVNHCHMMAGSVLSTWYLSYNFLYGTITYL